MSDHTAAADIVPAEILLHALAHGQTGRLADVEPLYRQLLERRPDNAHARHLLGVLAHQRGHHSDAVVLIRQAIALDGNVADFHNHLGAALHSLGILDEAARTVEQALVLRPDYADAHYNLAVIRYEQGRFADAILCAERCLDVEPDLPGARIILRRALHADAKRLEAEGQLDAAIARYLDLAGLARVDVPAAFPNLHTALADPARTREVRIAHQARQEPAPEISVIIPCFNAAETMDRAVRSVLDQDIAPIEIILVDDASSDRTLEAAISLAGAHPAITVLARSVNGGAGPARNDGIRAARGRLLCFLDADDEYAPGFFRVGLDRLGADPTIAAVRTGMKIVDLDQEVDPLRHRAAVNSSSSNILIRRGVIDLIGGFPERRFITGGQDVAVSKILDKYFKTLRDERPLLIYHIHANSHFGRFLADTRVENGEIIRVRVSAEQESGLVDLKMLMHERAFQERARAHLADTNRA